MKTLQKESLDKWGNHVISVTAAAENGLQAEFLSLGACIRKVSLRLNNEEEKVLTLSYKGIDQYFKCDSCAGMTIGPNAGRIPAINGLIANEGVNQIHGGSHNLTTHNWELMSIEETPTACTIKFFTAQTDGIDGWPGNRRYQVLYTLDDTGWLSITYRAETDCKTYFNMTNHTYWNLTGESSHGFDQILNVPSDLVCMNDENFLPVATQSCDSFFTSLQRPRLHKDHIPLGPSLNHSFFLRTASASRGFTQTAHMHETARMHQAASLRDPATGITLKMMTDAPALVVYGGDYLSKGIPLLGDQVSMPYCAVALEAQEMPALTGFKFTTPEKPFIRRIRFHISF